MFEKYFCISLISWILINSSNSLTQEFTSQTYPNPRTLKGAKDCNMKSISYVCDPDQVLSPADRYMFNNELIEMIKRTERKHGDVCDRKGFTPLLLIAHEGDQELADGINQQWNLDGQCKKAVIFFLSYLDHGLYYSTEPGTGFDQSDFLALKFGQEQYIAEGNYTFALQNIFKQIGGAKNIQVTSNDKPTDYKIQNDMDNSSSLFNFSFMFILSLFINFIVIH